MSSSTSSFNATPLRMYLAESVSAEIAHGKKVVSPGKLKPRLVIETLNHRTDLNIAISDSKSAKKSRNGRH